MESERIVPARAMHMTCSRVPGVRGPAMKNRHRGFHGFEHSSIHYLNALIHAMRFWESVGSEEKLARVLAFLVERQRPWMVDPAWKFRYIGQHERFCEILVVLFRCVVRHKGRIPEDHLRKFLRLMGQYQTDHVNVSRVRESEASLLAASGRFADAYNVLPHQSASLSSDNLPLYHHEMLGVLRKKQLCAMLRMYGGDEDSGEYPCSDSRLLKRAGKNIRQLSREAQDHFRRAMIDDPREFSHCMHIVELHLIEGDRKRARDMVAAFTVEHTSDHTREADPFDVYAQQLALLLEQLAESDTEPTDGVSHFESAIQCCIRMMDSSPCVDDTIHIAMQLYYRYQAHTGRGVHPDVLQALLTSVGQVEIPRLRQRALVLIENMLHELQQQQHHHQHQGEGGEDGQKTDALALRKSMALLAQQQHWHPSMFLLRDQASPVLVDENTTDEYIRTDSKHLVSLYLVWKMLVDRELLWSLDCIDDCIDDEVMRLTSDVEMSVIAHDSTGASTVHSQVDTEWLRQRITQHIESIAETTMSLYDVTS